MISLDPKSGAFCTDLGVSMSAGSTPLRLDTFIWLQTYRGKDSNQTWMAGDACSTYCFQLMVTLVSLFCSYSVRWLCQIAPTERLFRTCSVGCMPNIIATLNWSGKKPGGVSSAQQIALQAVSFYILLPVSTYLVSDSGDKKSSIVCTDR
jgi:hypothetical protein